MAYIYIYIYKNVYLLTNARTRAIVSNTFGDPHPGVWQNFDILKGIVNCHFNPFIGGSTTTHVPI